MPPPQKLRASTFRSHIEEFLNNLQIVLIGPRRPRWRLNIPIVETALHEPTRGRLPSRGLVYSFVVHEFFLTVLLVWPAATLRERHYRFVEDWGRVDKLAYFLPPLGGGHEGGGSNGKQAVGQAGKKGHPLPAPASRKGRVYPGPQPIVSNPERPTNRVQTLLQPNLSNPPTLKRPVPLPNLVIMARHVPSPPSLPNPASELPVPSLAFSIPPVPPNPLALTPSLEAPPPTPETTTPSASTAATPSQTAPSPEGTESFSLLAISTLPLSPDANFQIPRGEMRGQFEIGPEAGDTQNGALGPGEQGAEGTGSGEGGEAGAGGAGTEGLGQGAGGAGAGAGAGGGGTGQGSGSGTGEGYGQGTGTGTGSGAGSGPGSGPFPGISIIGGSINPGAGAAGGSSASGSQPDLYQHVYDMTITGIAASGGGIKDYGVFRNEDVYTVFIGMSHSTDPAPSWVLQYASLDHPRVPLPDGQAEINLDVADSEVPLVPPFATHKVAPDFPEEVAAQNRGLMVVVYGIINLAGKLEGLRLIHSPNVLLERPALEALSQWTFRPAERNGVPVAVKALLGIPLSLAQ